MKGAGKSQCVREKKILPSGAIQKALVKDRGTPAGLGRASFTDRHQEEILRGTAYKEQQDELGFASVTLLRLPGLLRYGYDNSSPQYTVHDR